jgi:hypothetical protein
VRAGTATWIVVSRSIATPKSLQRFRRAICRIECEESTALHRRAGGGQLERVLGNCVLDIAERLAKLLPLTTRYTRIALTLRRIVDQGIGYELALEARFCTAGQSCVGPVTLRCVRVKTRLESSGATRHTNTRYCAAAMGHSARSSRRSKSGPSPRRRQIVVGGTAIVGRSHMFGRNLLDSLGPPVVTAAAAATKS